MECYAHNFVPTNCIHCGGFLGEVCQDCGHWSDGGDFTASQSDIWCNCADSVSNFDHIHGWNNENDMLGFDASKKITE